MPALTSSGKRVGSGRKPIEIRARQTVLALFSQLCSGSMPDMTPFDEIIGGMQVESSLYARFLFRAPWGVRFATGDQARLVVISRGACWLSWSGAETIELLKPGACMIIQPGVEFVLSDMQDCQPVACEQLMGGFDGDLVTFGGEGAATELVSGRFSFDPVAAEPLIASMPPLVHVQLDPAHADLLHGTLQLMGAETRLNEFGAGMVISRLGDALFIQALRALCCQRRDEIGGWLAGLADQRLARALRAMHADLSRLWTVGAMAREAGLSRSTFAVTFRDVVGEAPLDYLTGWRMYRAKVLLASTEQGLSRIAALVGYDTDAAFSRAFRRRFGMPPGQWRRERLATGEATGESELRHEALAVPA
jgi:AraC-like DNA-binding protein